MPTSPFYLFGQHFSAISAAGPIAGPIIACVAFGWLPCLLWIALGVVLIGAVHDFSTLTASLRHSAKSVAEITRDQLGLGAGRAMMAFIWIALVYVTVAFTDITAGTFVAGDEALAGETRFNPGGAVALHHRVVIQGSPPNRLHTDTDAFCPGDNALGSRVYGLLEFAGGGGVRY